MCGAAREIFDHVYTDSCDRDCNNCGAFRQPPHDYEDEYDDTCDTCGEWREVPEKPEKPEETIVYGDADGDGVLTLLDANLLTQYLSGWDVTLVEVTADVDGDGDLTLLDANLLSQYLSGWDVKLG